MNGSAFRFRLERVRAVRERSEKLAKQELAEAISRRASAEADLRLAEAHLERAHVENRARSGDTEVLGATELLARQVFVERIEAQRGDHARELQQRETDVASSDAKLVTAASEHEMLNRLRERHRGEYEREAARHERNALDEIAAARFGRELGVSAEAITAAVGMPTDEMAVAARERQLQTLISQAREVSVAGVVTTSPASSPQQAVPGDFASALQAATTADSAPLGAPSEEVGAGAGSSEYDPLIQQAAARYGLDPAVLHGLVEQESGFDPNAQSSAGAAGLTQLMPGTAASLGVGNPLDPSESIEGGARYLSQLMAQFGGNTEDALAAYNAGPGAVAQYGGIPPYAETQSYVSKVLGYAEAYRQTQPAPSVVGGVV